MHIYLKNNPAKFIPIRSDRGLGFSEELCLNKNNNMSSDIGWPVPDPEMYAFNKWMHNYVAEESSVY